MYSFNIYLLSIYYVQGTVLGTGAIAVPKTGKPLPEELTVI